MGETGGKAHSMADEPLARYCLKSVRNVCNASGKKEKKKKKASQAKPQGRGRKKLVN